MDSFELTSRVTDEITDFLLDIGIEPGHYSYDYKFNEEDNTYAATVGIMADDDVDDIIAAFEEYREEFADHMEVTIPEVEVSLIINVEGEGTVDDNRPGAPFTFALDEEGYGCTDDESSADIDSVEGQYEEEGLTILDDEEAELVHLDEMGDDDEDDTDTILDEYVKASRLAQTDMEEDDDENMFLSNDDEGDDAYTPSPEDMEDLWKSFGVVDDE